MYKKLTCLAALALFTINGQAQATTETPQTQLGSYKLLGIQHASTASACVKMLKSVPASTPSHKLNSVVENKILQLAKANANVSDASLNKVPTGYGIQLEISEVLQFDGLRIVKILRHLKPLPGRNPVRANPVGLAPAFATIAEDGSITVTMETKAAPWRTAERNEYLHGSFDVRKVLDQVRDLFLHESQNQKINQQFGIGLRSPESGGAFMLTNFTEIAPDTWLIRASGHIAYSLFGALTEGADPAYISEFKIFVSVIVKDGEVKTVLPEAGWNLEQLRIQQQTEMQVLKASIQDPQNLRDTNAPYVIFNMKDGTDDTKDSTYRVTRINVEIAEYHPQLSEEETYQQKDGFYWKPAEYFLEGAPGAFRFLPGYYDPATDTIVLYKRK
jgi:hypothetical protein